MNDALTGAGRDAQPGVMVASSEVEGMMAGERNARRHAVAAPLASSTRSRLGALVPTVERFAPHLAVASALLFLLGVWAPWLQGAVTIALPDGLHTGPRAESGSDVGLGLLLTLLPAQASHARGPLAMWSYVVLVLVWEALPFGALLLSLALWQRTSRVLLRLYRWWLALITLGVVAGVARSVALTVQPVCTGICVSASWHIAWGPWLAVCALALGWVSLVGLDRQSDAASSPRPEAARHARLALVGAGACTLGVVLWALAILLLPWVTAGCSGVSLSLTHFARGGCMGLDGYDVLSAGLINGTSGAVIGALLNTPQQAIGIIVFLLCLGGILALLLWRPRAGRVHRSLRVPVVAWLCLATLTFVVCWQGTQLRLVSDGAVVTTSAPLVHGPGITTAVVALLLGWTGGALIWLSKR